MASFLSSTRSIRKGQAAVVCQLCKIDSKLRGKCLQCRMMMCKKCLDDVHSKFVPAQNHTIVDIKEMNSPSSAHQEEEKQDLTKVKCTEHSDQNCIQFCTLCDKLVCDICIETVHNKHEIGEISEWYNLQEEKLKYVQRHINSKLKTLAKEKEDLKKHRFLEQTSYKKSKQGILDYKKSLIESIEKHSNKLLSELDHKFDEILDILEKAEKNYEEIQNTLIQKNQDVNELLESEEGNKMISSGKLIKLIMEYNDNVNTQQSFEYVPKFIPENLSKIPLLYSHLQKVTSPCDTHIKVVEHFNTDFHRTSNLIVCSDDTFWVNDGIKNLVHKVSQVQNSRRIMSTFNLAVNDMTLFPSGGVLICVRGQTTLKVISQGIEIKDSSYDVSPLRPVAVHVTHDKKVVIGTRNSGPWFPASGPRRVFIFDMKGQQEKVFQYDSQKKPLFTIPARLTSTSENSIVVVDWLSKDKGRVIILDKDGATINIYTGHHDVNNDDNLFKPFNIITTRSDNFVISDCKNHTLHILSNKGEIITYYNTRDFNIELPCSLSLDKSEMLYIGCDTYEGGRENARIYKMDNFVW